MFVRIQAAAGFAGGRLGACGMAPGLPAADGFGLSLTGFGSPVAHDDVAFQKQKGNDDPVSPDGQFPEFS